MSAQTKSDASVLVEAIGDTATATLAGCRSRELPGWWVHGSMSPTPIQARRLEVAARLWTDLVAAEGPDVARALLVGAWPSLGDESPVSFLRSARTDEEFELVAAGPGAGH